MYNIIEENKKRKALLQMCRGDKMMKLFEDKGRVTAKDTFDQAIEKIRNAIQGQINEVYPVFKPFYKIPQWPAPFVDCYTKVLEQAKFCMFYQLHVTEDSA